MKGDERTRNTLTAPPQLKTMTAIYFSELDSPDDILGIDIKVNVYGMMDNPVGRIIDVTAPNTDLDLGDEDYPYEDIEITIEDHLHDRTWTRTGKDCITPAIIGTTYTLYYGEARQDDGTWERITDKHPSEGYARDYLTNADTDKQTRLMTETYEVGLDQTNKTPVRLTADGLDCTLTGRNTLEEALATVSLDQRISVNIDAEHSIGASVTDISPHELNTDAESSGSADGSLVPDNYEITATDILDGTLTITYDPEFGQAYIERTPTNESDPDFPDHIDIAEDPGELSGELHALDAKGNPVEYYNIPWFNKLEQRINTSDALLDEIDVGTIGPVVGHVYTAPRDRFELYHASLDRHFTTDSKSINDLVTVETPNTYKNTYPS